MIRWLWAAAAWAPRDVGVLAVACALATGCGPLVCRTVVVDVYAVDGKPRPAGRVVVSCNGKAVLEATAATVTAAP